MATLAEKSPVSYSKSFNQLVDSLEVTRGYWGRLHGFYKKFCERAMDMSDRASGVNEIVTARVGDDLYIQYLDRRWRLSFGFDRASTAGVICVDDLSVVGVYERDEPVRIETISFDTGGISDVVEKDGQKLSLLDPTQAIRLAFGIVDRALNHNPWKA